MKSKVLLVVFLAVAGLTVAGMSCRAPAARGPAERGTEMAKTNAAQAAAGGARLSEDDFRAKLSAEQYRVLREGGTEAPYSGKYLHHTGNGVYACAACGNPLYQSSTQYDACGWPSFSDALPGAIATRDEAGAPEVVCAKCGSHLGHLFDDGPAPTGKRH